MYTIFLAFDRMPCQKSNVSFRMYPASILQKFPIWLHCSVHLMQTNLFKLTIIIYIDLCKPKYEIFKDGMGLWAVPHYLIGPNHLLNYDCHLFRHEILLQFFLSQLELPSCFVLVFACVRLGIDPFHGVYHVMINPDCIVAWFKD